MTDQEKFEQWLSEASLEDLKKALSPESLDILKMNFMDSGAYDDALYEYIGSAFSDDVIKPSQFSSRPWLEIEDDESESPLDPDIEAAEAEEDEEDDSNETEGD